MADHRNAAKEKPRNLEQGTKTAYLFTRVRVTPSTGAAAHIADKSEGKRGGMGGGETRQGGTTITSL